MVRGQQGPGQVGLSYKETAEAITSFLEIVIHTLLCIRSVYPPSTFTRRRAHGVPVYQSRHPQVREYVAEVVAAMGKEIMGGTMRRCTVVVKRVEDGLPVERYILDLGYLGVGLESHQKEAGLQGAPTADELSLMLRGLLIRLSALDGQLEDNKGELTFAIIVETKDDSEPSSNVPADGSTPPWIPALATDTLQPPSQAPPDCPAAHEPLLHVKAVETGVIDMRLMVQECVAKTGLDRLQPLAA